MDEMLKTNAGWFKDYDAMAKFGLEKARKDKVKKDKKAHTEKKRKLKDEDRGFQTKKTQQIFNKYIRLRDEGKKCISCGRNDGEIHHDARGGLWDCGHFRTVGACPELRFHEWNANRQCKWCNRDKSGDQLSHRRGIISRYGWDRINYLERDHGAKRYTIANLKTIQKWYKRKLRRLEQ